MTVVWVAIGAAVGAPLRYLIDRAIQSRHARGFPWGTLTVNLVGSFVLGAATALTVALGPRLPFLLLSRSRTASP